MDDYILSGLAVDLRKTVGMTELILEELDRLSSLLNKETSSCARFLDAASRGSLEPYLGSKKSLKPGGAGIRPGGAGIRPCIELDDTL